MSKCCYNQCCPMPMPMPRPVQRGGCYNFSTLIVLILILLQWGYGKKYHRDCEDGEGYYGGHGLIDNSILFIIAIFFLVCGCGCGCGTGYGSYGGYGGYGY